MIEDYKKNQLKNQYSKKLPIVFDSEFFDENLFEFLDEYFCNLSQINDSSLRNKVKIIIDGIKSSIHELLKGKPHNAYTELAAFMSIRPTNYRFDS